MALLTVKKIKKKIDCKNKFLSICDFENRIQFKKIIRMYTKIFWIAQTQNITRTQFDQGFAKIIFREFSAFHFLAPMVNDIL